MIGMALDSVIPPQVGIQFPPLAGPRLRGETLFTDRVAVAAASG